MAPDPIQPAQTARLPEQDKPALRARMKVLIESLSQSDRAAESSRVCAAIERLPVWQTARCVMVFAPLASEPSIEPLALALLRAPGSPPRRMCVPAIDWATKTLSPVEITDWTRDLVPGPRSILVPRANLRQMPLNEIDVVLVPGLAFDAGGRRLGRGGGFYDRFLASPSLRAATVGVCFSCQRLPDGAMAIEPHDRPVAHVISGAR